MSEVLYYLRCGEIITSKYGKKFCSNKCARDNARELSALATRKDKSKTCLECSKIFESPNKNSKFCSHSCSAKHTNRLRRTKEINRCKECFAEIDYRSEFCSYACRKDNSTRLWLSGELDATTAWGTSDFAREYIFSCAENKCEKCGYSTLREDGAGILQLHHVDGNWKNNCPENLQCLCPNCHALTDNFGSRNIGNGREKKRNSFAGLV